MRFQIWDMNRGIKARRWTLVWPLMVCVLLAGAPAFVAPASCRHFSAPLSEAQPHPAGADQALAFRIGEKLSYRISWAALMTAATAELAVSEKRAFYGHEAWHFRALARTVDAARLLYQLDNQFDSYADSATLASFRYEAYLREQGKSESKVTRMAGEGLPVQNDGPMVRVLPGTRDPLGLLYYLRTVDWSKTRQVRTPVFDGRRLLEVQARVRGNGTVIVPAGKYAATRVELRLFERKKELTDVRIWVWFANDARRAPALMEAQMPFGKLRVELVRASIERTAM